MKYQPIPAPKIRLILNTPWPHKIIESNAIPQWRGLWLSMAFQKAHESDKWGFATPLYAPGVCFFIAEFAIATDQPRLLTMRESHHGTEHIEHGSQQGFPTHPKSHTSGLKI